MPTRNRRPCGRPGCRELVSTPYCQRHTPTRVSRSKRGYTRLWQRIREQHLRHQPECQLRTHCDGVSGFVRFPPEVDHIDGDSSNNVSANLRTVCKRCHSHRTSKEQSGW